ncbi:hypothetical protein FF1_014772 [Malus domestica]
MFAAVEIVGVWYVNVVKEGFEGVKIALLGAVGDFYVAEEAVVGSELELIVDPNDLVEVTADCEVTESR